jgi:hypothetical protein
MELWMIGARIGERASSNGFQPGEQGYDNITIIACRGDRGGCGLFGRRPGASPEQSGGCRHGFDRRSGLPGHGLYFEGERRVYEQ